MGETKTRTRQPTRRASSADTSPVAQTINHILEYAVKAGASDVHIEPRAGYGVVRQRIDGMLQVTTKLPGASFGAVVLQFKKLANLNTAQKLMPQAGQYKASISRRPYEIQIATLPVVDGERLTLHLADATQTPASLSDLGYWGSALAHINHALAQPHGLVIVSSADQTSTLLTLSSMLSTLSSPYLSSASVEQNLTYQLPHVKQTVVKKDIGMTFARRLKHVLTAVPNVVMVSDVQDSRTAKTIAEAAASRQLVLAGVHAPNIISALAGFTQLSTERALVASNLQVAVSQKLVPKLCLDCREAYQPSPALSAKLSQIFGINNSARMERLHSLEAEALAEQLGVNPGDATSAQPSTTTEHIVRLWRPKAAGCKNCNHSGFVSRITINEAIPNSPALQAALHASGSITEIRKIARTSGMIPLAQDALVKALRGLLPIETVLAHTNSK